MGRCAMSCHIAKSIERSAPTCAKPKLPDEEQTDQSGIGDTLFRLLQTALLVVVGTCVGP
jgi:hypothetical protein